MTKWLISRFIRKSVANGLWTLNEVFVADRIIIEPTIRDLVNRFLPAYHLKRKPKRKGKIIGGIWEGSMDATVLEQAEEKR